MFVISPVALDIVKITLGVCFQPGGIFVNVFSNAAPIVEAFIKVGLSVSV